MGRAEDLYGRIATEGLVAIKDLINEAKSEESFLDFKRSADNGGGVHLHSDDGKHLSKALSGFANSDGGVIVWGVGARPGANGDVASSLHPLSNCKAFASLLENKISWGTMPPVHGVRSFPVPDESGVSGYVATLIPASAIGPHQATEGKHYLIRSGASFQPVTHTVLAGMFGRKPQPELSLILKNTQASRFVPRAIATRHMSTQPVPEMYQVGLCVVISNDSAVPARDAYVAWRVPEFNESMHMEPAVEEVKWRANRFDMRSSGCIAAESHRLVPFSEDLAVSLMFTFTPPVTIPISLQLVIGASSAAPKRTEIQVSSDQINEALHAIKLAAEQTQKTPGYLDYLSKRLLGLPTAS